MNEKWESSWPSILLLITSAFHLGATVTPKLDPPLQSLLIDTVLPPLVLVLAVLMFALSRRRRRE